MSPTSSQNPQNPQNPENSADPWHSPALSGLSRPSNSAEAMEPSPSATTARAARRNRAARNGRAAKAGRAAKPGGKATAAAATRPTRPLDVPGAGNAPDAAGRGPGEAPYEDAYLDGVFTYCLSLMCEHDAATAALGEAVALAERQHERGRRPAAPELRRSWLYALARWACLRRLAVAQGGAAGPVATGEDADAGRRRRELATLSWPEAAGTTAEQREALELAVRHKLSVREIARVLGLPESATHTLLTTAACEVERTRAALAAVESAGCPATAALAGDDRRVLLGPRLRGELVRHVDECTACRLVAQRAMVGVGWPGTAPGSRTRLVVLPAPRAAVHAARLAVLRARAQYTPRCDRAGFPVAARDRAARREKLRGRAVTTTVVAAVLAAPVLALWAACRGAPVTGEAGGHEEPAVTAQDDPGAGLGPGSEVAAQGEGDPRPEAAGAEGGRADGEAAERRGGREARDRADGGGGAPDGAPERAARGAGTAEGPGEEGAPGRLSAEAVTTDSGTRITLTASGGAPVDWTAEADADWLLLSVSSGTLRPGETQVIEVSVDRAREPAGAWQARVTLSPAATVVTVEGEGAAPEEPTDPPGEEPPPEDPPPAEGGDPAASGGGGA
ncbi:BACON domain-containing protein [Streptomyces hoynatensis]|uniref:Sigma-70 family RNA polymerase sigma factor n=1 Tax=Streptomyces hoynatensis TaxID=1141874 RepID=A0A3A9Z361_9ACTN|nr:sigma-70 family RNA polymerase sigma factor [Streptomyces hoynatensis]RKN42922.1 sigma-70 family RNA polymerase sigma factor [Streptomyces hoynatensis]